ncbi:MAG: hypothetical protein ABSG43_02495 [Solirubrobacteraceae bacterium]|jgi:predicted Zn-ribbon and HTH transcriptional regulator
MREHRNPCPSPPPKPAPAQAVNLVRVEPSLAVCVACGHEESRATVRERITCPDCGSSARRQPPSVTEAPR